LHRKRGSTILSMNYTGPLTPFMTAQRLPITTRAWIHPTESGISPCGYLISRLLSRGLSFLLCGEFLQLQTLFDLQHVCPV